jgi:hypothetical protein
MISFHPTHVNQHTQHRKHHNATYETSHMQHGHAIIET